MLGVAQATGISTLENEHANRSLFPKLPGREPPQRRALRQVKEDDVYS